MGPSSHAYDSPSSPTAASSPSSPSLARAPADEAAIAPSTVAATAAARGCRSRQSRPSAPPSSRSRSRSRSSIGSTLAHALLHDKSAVPLQPWQPSQSRPALPNPAAPTVKLQSDDPGPYYCPSPSRPVAETHACLTKYYSHSSPSHSLSSPSSSSSSPSPAEPPPPHHGHHQSVGDEAIAPSPPPIASPAGPAAGAAADDAMASHRSPFLERTAASDRLDGPYGSLSQASSRDTSPNDSDDEHAAAVERHHTLMTSGTMRSNTSHRSRLSKASSRVSEDLDASFFISGVEGRFGVPEAPMSESVTGAMSDAYMSDTSDDVPLVGADSDNQSEASDNEDENSPHEAVRASVPPTDDTTLSINTPRMWCLSVLFSFLGSSTNLFFSLRYPSVAITPVIALLLVHPLGHLWDILLKRSHDPKDEFIEGHRVPSTSSPRSWRLWLGQGRWNEKEHTCVYVSSNVAFGFAFATDVIVEQTQFYNQPAPIIYQILLTISTQVLGYGFAGLARRFLVRPSGMIWPGTLMSAAMFGTLHRQDNKPASGWTISRWNFFYIVCGGAFLFYFLPGLLMPCLSYFNVVTWFAPKNVVIANLFGVSSGLGLFPLTFDWAQITYIGSPLLVPFWAAVNVVGGLALVMWIIAPLMYYANVLYTSYMPIISTAVFDNTGNLYNVSRILTPEFVFDRQAYADYSRVFLPVTYMLSYGMQFAGLAALLTHTACWHGKDIWTTWKKALEEARDEEKTAYQPISGDGNDMLGGPSSRGGNGDGMGRESRSTSHGEGLLTREDIHSRLMKRYKDVPMSWYLLTFVSMTAIGMFVVEYYPVHLPWWGLLLSLSIGAIFFIPNGIIMAVTNQHSSIYLICQLICGAVFPGRPIANMVFVTYGYISSAQGIKFASDLKLGHYMKIPPRTMFTVQVVATLVASLTQIGVLNWMFANVRGLCTAEAVNGFTCPIARVHFNGSILWGVVGVNEFFGPDAIYRALVWCFPLGAVLPIPLWLYARRRRDSILRKVNLPVVFGAMGWIPPATGLNFSVWALVCYVFNFHIKRRAGAWWAKYTMTLSAALDSGLAIGIVVVFFGFVYPGWMQGFSWWGTEIYKQGCDWQACPYRTLADGEHFGPDQW